MQLFDRRHGRFVPAVQAKGIFEQVNAVFRKVEDLRYVIGRIETGASHELKIGSVPSIANVMVPRAIETVRRRHPDLVIDINTLKIEEAIDYLLLGKGEVVAISSRFDHLSLTFEPLAAGKLQHRPRRTSARRARDHFRKRDRAASADRDRPERSLRADHVRHLS